MAVLLLAGLQREQPAAPMMEDHFCIMHHDDNLHANKLNTVQLYSAKDICCEGYCSKHEVCHSTGEQVNTATYTSHFVFTEFGDAQSSS